MRHAAWDTDVAKPALFARDIASSLALSYPFASDGAGNPVLRRRTGSAFFDGRGFALSLALAHGERASLRATMIGASDARPTAARRGTARVHRYDRRSAQVDAPTYEALAWEELYPGIDMLAEPMAAGFTYRFVLSPGADPTQIVMSWAGVRSVRASADGRGLELDTAGGIVRVDGLRAFAIEGGERRELAVRFVVDGERVSFSVEGWTGAVPLIIDPTVTWSSYLGGQSFDDATGVATDAAGNVYVVSATSSSDFPTTAGLDTTFGGGSDTAITKLAPDGKMVWSTLLGGTGIDRGAAIAVDASGNIYVVGDARSGEFPTTPGAHDTTFGGGNSSICGDAFVTKLGPTGMVVWSTYLGGAGIDCASGVALDASGNVFITGETRSTDFPSVNGFDTTLAGTVDGFVTKMSPAGVLLWSSYIGGSGTEWPNAVAVDPSGNVFVTGSTQSADFPLKNAFDSTRSGEEPFVVKASNTGALVWASFLGGANIDYAYGLATDASGNLFVTGSTQSTDLPGFATGTKAGAFVTKIDAAGTVAWSSSLGGATGYAAGRGAVTDAAGNVYVTGNATGTDFIPTAYQLTYGGGSNDAFVASLSPTGAILWSSFLGGTLRDQGDAIALDNLGNVFVVGTTESKDFPTVTPFDATHAGTYEGFVFHKPLPLALGSACVSAWDCPSNCADGVCCDKPCTGGCEACSTARKGGGTNGYCGSAAADTDPKNTCAPGTGTCAADGMCDGAGKCRTVAKAGTPCGVTACAGASVSGKVCAGDSPACIDATIDCAPYACTGGACKTACATEVDCDPASYCSGGVCIKRIATGSACTESRQCTSGFCADGYCCNAKCDGRCEACDGTVKGTCAPMSGVPRNARPKCGGEGTLCAGTCDGVNGATCTHPVGTECSARCAGASQAIGRCDNTGACKEGAAESCNGYVCDGDKRCKTSCATNAECAEQFSCKSSVCEPEGTTCTDDRSAMVGSDGTITPCGITRCKAGKCVGVCSSSDDCAVGYACDGATCVAGAPPPEEEGGCGIGRSHDAGRSFSLFALVALTGLAMRRRGKEAT